MLTRRRVLVRPVARFWLCVLLVGTLVPLSRPAPAHESLPLGDGKVSAEPRTGYVFACQQHFHEGPGAWRSGDWIADGRWDPDAKPVVLGDVRWPGSAISIALEGDRRVIRANNLPNHPTGIFPIQPGTEAFRYDRNPNAIVEQPILLTLPALPQVAEHPLCVPMGMVGFARSGAALFNALDAGGRDAPAHEIQDRCNGHPEPRGQYHYHGWSPCLEGQEPAAPVGWMLDGFPILGPVDAQGRMLTNDDLDECHGRLGPVLIDGRTIMLYHYHFTHEYPYTIGCFRGAVESRLLRPPHGPPPQP